MTSPSIVIMELLNILIPFLTSLVTAVATILVTQIVQKRQQRRDEGDIEVQKIGTQSQGELYIQEARELSWKRLTGLIQMQGAEIEKQKVIREEQLTELKEHYEKKLKELEENLKDKYKKIIDELKDRIKVLEERLALYENGR